MRVICLVLSIVFTIACTAVHVEKHPDFNYPPTSPDTVIIYNFLKPERNFKVIGKITIDDTWTVSSKNAQLKIKRQAALLGGDAVWLTNEKIDIHKISLGSTTTGTATIWGNTAYYTSKTINRDIYIPERIKYGYVIKFIDSNTNIESLLNQNDTGVEREENYYNRGLSKLNNGDFSSAIQDFNKAIELDPKNKEAITFRGMSKNGLGDFSSAIQDFNKVIELDPKNKEAFTCRGMSKNGLGDYRGAIKDYNKAIDLDKENKYAYYFRGLSKLFIGDKDGGCLDLSKAGELGYEVAYDAIKKFCQ